MTLDRVGQPDGEVRWMRAAMRLAHHALQAGETPVGAVVVRAGVVLGRGYNRREGFSDVTQHAELMAIRQAERKLGAWRLDACDLYVTLEPCIMCAGAIVQARIQTVFFGTSDPKAGACGSIVDVFAIRQNHHVHVSGGLMADECSQILKAFFRKRRQQNKILGARAERRSQAIHGEKTQENSS